MDAYKKAVQRDEEKVFGTADPVYAKLGGYVNKWFKPRHTNYKDWIVKKV